MIVNNLSFHFCPFRAFAVNMSIAQGDALGYVFIGLSARIEPNSKLK